MEIDIILFYVSHVFLVSLFEVTTSLSDVRYFTYVARELLFMFLYATVRFRFGAIVYRVGAPERYSHICVFKYIGTITT